MNSTPIIKKIVSGFLICVFALSITPVLVVHNLFATHIDKNSGHDLQGTQISKAGFHCNCENFVAEGNFLGGSNFIDFTAPKIYSAYTLKAGFTFFSRHHFFSELRGPPVYA